MRLKNSRLNQVRLLFNKYKGRASTKGQEFSISFDEFRKLTKMRCGYCGVGPRQRFNRSNNDKLTYLYNGLDRLDSNKGYIMTNLVACCFPCNGMKSKRTPNDFVKRCIKIAQFYSDTWLIQWLIKEGKKKKKKSAV